MLRCRVFRIFMAFAVGLSVCGPATAAEARTEYLDTVERLVRWLHRYQDDQGAVIDPTVKQEYQYTTPYYCFALYTCRAAGRCADLGDSFERAMDHCTEQVAQGSAAIPDQHGEFFLASLGELMWLIRSHPEESEWIDPDHLGEWRQRLSVPVEKVIEGIGDKLNNHRTYAMKGEYYRGKAGLIPATDADAFIRDAWETRGIKFRLNDASGAYLFFEDWNSEPQSQAVSMVGMANLLPIAYSDGTPLLTDARRTQAVWGARYFVDPTGQCPPNGRTDNHVFNDALFCAAFEWFHGAYAGDPARRDTAAACGALATQAYRGMRRWLRDDPPYDGIFSITKNHFDPADRVGYQPASQVSNYTAALAMLLAEAWWSRPEGAAEQAYVPVEGRVGAVAGAQPFNARGTHAIVNLAGDSVPKYGIYWTPLGVVRLARAGWDSRLGPSDGQYDGKARTGLSLAPTWQAGLAWVHLAEMAANYRGFTAAAEDSEEDTLEVVYAPVTGAGGPMFGVALRAVTGGILLRFRSPSATPFAVSLPILADDGRALVVTQTKRSVSVRYPEGLSDGSEQHFIVLNRDATVEKTETRVLSSYGWLEEYRARAGEGDKEIAVFAYMRRKDEPELKEIAARIESNLDAMATDPAEAIAAIMARP